MKIIAAEEKDGFVTATVRFEDGMDQTVMLPDWADKEAIRKEARRLRRNAENQTKNRKARQDLLD